MTDRTHRSFIHRAGWWGVGLLAGSLFFLIGALVSLLDGDFGVALQSFIVCLLLVGTGLYVAHGRRA